MSWWGVIGLLVIGILVAMELPAVLEQRRVAVEDEYLDEHDMRH